MSAPRTFETPDQPEMLLAHAAYGFGSALGRRGGQFRFREVRTYDAFRDAIGTAEVVVASGLWRNDLLALAPRLVFIQSVSVGIDNFDLDRIRAAGIRMANARGANAIAVSEHALALMLALSRQVHLARDNQARKHWRPMNGDASTREAELAGKTLVVVGLGAIGERIARLGKAFGMHVIGVRQNASAGSESAHAVVETAQLNTVLPTADVIVLACPLTPRTERLIDQSAFAAMKPTAHLVNVARGRVVDEVALIDALAAGRLAAAGLDVTSDEPLAVSSPLWTMPNVLITPHAAGETQAYEDRLLDMTIENIRRVGSGAPELVNQII